MSSEGEEESYHNLYPSKKKRSSDGEDVILPGLPNDIAKQCIARVPKCFHTTLTTVSNSWHSLLTSLPFYFSQQSPSSSSSWVYAVLDSDLFNRPAVCTAIDLQNSVSLSFPPLPLSAAKGFSFSTVLDNKLYLIGGLVHGDASPNVYVCDPLLNRWDAAPPTTTPREWPVAATVEGKIYVIGGSDPTSSYPWGEVYDPSTNTWSPIPTTPRSVGRDSGLRAIAIMDEKLFILDFCQGIIFDPALSSWSTFSTTLYSGWKTHRAVVVQDILFTYGNGKIRGYDPKQDMWLELRGMGKHLLQGLRSSWFVDVGGKLGIFEQKVHKLHFAIVNIHRKSGLLKGKVLYCGSVPTGAHWLIRRLHCAFA
eukprot:Gb_20608 [translate_table: standard]